MEIKDLVTFNQIFNIYNKNKIYKSLKFSKKKALIRAFYYKKFFK